MANFCAKPFEARRFPQADANFSFQFLVANTLLHGTVRQEHYGESVLRDAPIRALLDKTSLAPLERPELGVEIEVQTRKGRTLREPHGPRPDRHPFMNPATRQDVVAKFRQQVQFAGYVPSTQADEIIQRVEHLELEPDMADFVTLLTRSNLPTTEGLNA
jgi:2-methylcitrate dehydratase PrpD